MNRSNYMDRCGFDISDRKNIKAYIPGLNISGDIVTNEYTIVKDPKDMNLYVCHMDYWAYESEQLDEEITNDYDIHYVMLQGDTIIVSDDIFRAYLMKNTNNSVSTEISDDTVIDMFEKYITKSNDTESLEVQLNCIMNSSWCEYKNERALIASACRMNYENDIMKLYYYAVTGSYLTRELTFIELLSGKHKIIDENIVKYIPRLKPYFRAAIIEIAASRNHAVFSFIKKEILNIFKD